MDREKSEQEDIRMPFTCIVTKQDCGGRIHTLRLEIDEEIISCIPLSESVTESFSKPFLSKIKNVVIKEISTHYKKNAKLARGRKNKKL